MRLYQQNRNNFCPFFTLKFIQKRSGDEKDQTDKRAI